MNYGVDTRTKKKKRTSKKNVEERCMSSHENKTFRSRSVVKEKGMVFGFWKTATAVVGPEIYIYIYIYIDIYIYIYSYTQYAYKRVLTHSVDP
jgi:hypothetical protein